MPAEPPSLRDVLAERGVLGSWGAVVLAGGSARRLGGIDKAAVQVGGVPLLDGVVAAAYDAGASPVVVVGPRRTTAREVVWTREVPAGGGPVAALAAGLDALAPGTDAVLLLAVDLPHARGLVARLALEVEPSTFAEAEAVVAIDGDGRLQSLAGIYLVEPLRAAIDRTAAVGPLAGAPLRAVVEPLRRRSVRAPDHTADIDTPADLARWADPTV